MEEIAEEGGRDGGGAAIRRQRKIKKWFGGSKGKKIAAERVNKTRSLRK